MKHINKHRKRNIKSLIILLGIFMLSGLCACGSRDGQQEENTEIAITDKDLEENLEETKDQEEEAPGKEQEPEDNTQTEETEQIEKQLQLITDYCMDLWQKDSNENEYEMYFYTVTDLDRNGRLELICASVQGTGIYTYSNYFEVNEQSDGLTQCDVKSDRGDSEADIVVEAVPVYYDGKADAYHYIFSDYTRDGMAMSYENIRELSLKNGEITDKVLVYKESIYDENGMETAEYYNAATKEAIDSEQYESMVETVFAGFEKKTAAFVWEGRLMSELKEMSREQIQDMLQKSYKGFSIHE